MRYFIVIALFLSCQLQAQSSKRIKQPKLVVGIVVDQMRPDYLTRYDERLSSTGFKRLLNKGNECENVFINYLPSYTGPGHTAIYTGSVPAFHGIASNEWYDRKTGKPTYCTGDSTVKAVGGGDRAGKMSPRNLWANTIGDELRLASNFKSKVIAISLKDRASILPGGHLANGAYWMDDSLGNFMTSSYYQSDLPSWVKDFNEKKWATQLMKNEWNTLYPISSYTNSSADDNAYEGKYFGEASTTFPHKISGLKRSDIRKTCFGNDIITELAKASIEHEALGGDDITDFLCISYSSTDYVGHQFGPNSIEIEDTYLRLDRNIAELLDYLDEHVGKNNYTLFLTADHGVAHNPAYLMDHKMPAGFFSGKQLKDTLNKQLQNLYQVQNCVLDVSENFIWLKDSAIIAGQLNRQEVVNAILDRIKYMPEIQFAVDMQHIQEANIPMNIKETALNGYVAKRGGEILLILNPNWIDTESKTGTTHGTWNPYDTHIPLLWYGWGIQPGRTTKLLHMTDIAATLATLLHIQMPNACIGQCISEVMK